MHDAILVIDVQQGLFNTDPAPHEAREVVERINTLTAHARALRIPVFMIQHERPDTPLEYGSEGWELLTGLVVSQTDVMIRKTSPDSFLRTKLLQELQARSIDRLVVCGYATEFCVDTTVRSGAAHDYPVVLVSDGHTSHDKEHMSAQRIRDHHNATLPNISSFNVAITALSAEQYLSS